MFDHLGFITADAARALAFYEAALAPLGLSIVQRHPDGAFIVAGEGERFLYVGPDAPEFWRDGHAPARSPIHLCFTAPSAAAVDAFHAAALTAGGTDNGRPGERDPGYYAAYVLDPDGNNIEAAHRAA
ncbi:VOC family protein [Marinibacterium sp. SX1]|uniref:VOC family protein n=1 Tax=Marinibacterium sp. SX1 TaxID=3388424 RepID=UPI003D17DF25